MRILIVGSCVSRDIFTRLQRYGHKLVAYKARQSLASACFPGDAEKFIDSSAFSSNFQLRSVRGDFQADLFPTVRELAGQFDVVLWDLIDERRGLLKLEDGTLVTDNYELVETGLRDTLPVDRHIEFGSDEHFMLWKSGVQQLKEALADAAATSKVILVAPQFASCTVQGDSLEGREGIHSHTWLASRYERYVEFIKKNLDVSIVELPAANIYADTEHRWGLAVYHYAPSTENLFAESVNNQIPLRSLSHEQYRDYSEARGIMSSANIANLGITEINELVEGLPLQAKIVVHGKDYPLLAMFNGAIDPDRAKGEPVYQRFTWQSEIKANIIYFHDSTQTLHPELRIAWGMGDGDRTLAPLHAGALRGLQDKLQSIFGYPATNDLEKVFLFGSSAGGFQALRVATYLQNSRTMVNNPQLDWLKYEVRPAVRDVLYKVFPNDSQMGFRSRHASKVSLMSLWDECGSVPEFVYLLNALSSPDMKFQYVPFIQWINAHSANCVPPISIRGYEDPEAGHNPLSKDTIIRIINNWLNTYP